MNEYVNASAAHQNSGSLSYSEYIRNPIDQNIKKTVSGAFIAWLVLAGFNIILALAAETFPVDGLIMAGLAFWWKFRADKTCAIVSMVYGIANIIFLLAATGRFAGWLPLVVGIVEIVNVKKIKEKYDAYVSGNTNMAGVC